MAQDTITLLVKLFYHLQQATIIAEVSYFRPCI
jgi:hypothetical protein